MKKNVALGFGILFFIIFYILIIGVYADKIADFATNQPSLIQLFLYYVTQTQFIIIFIGTFYVAMILKKKILHGIGAGILIDLATDMSSTPHCVLSSGFISNAPNLTLCSDTIYIRWLDAIFPHIISYSLYYWILPIIFIVLAFELLGVTKFTKYVLRV